MLLLIVAISLLLFYNYFWKRRSLPPGPPPLPIFGNMKEIEDSPPGYDAYRRWRDKYGPVYTYWIGEKPIVAIADYELMKETVIDDGESYVDRDFFNEFFMILRKNTYGLTSLEGDPWIEQRRFTIKTFTKLGMGKNVMQDKMIWELTRTFDFLDEALDGGKRDLDITEHVEVCVASIIYSILFNYQITKERLPDFFRMKRAIYEYTGLFGDWAVQMIMGNPYLFKDLPFFRNRMKQMTAAYDRMSDDVSVIAEDAIKNYASDMSTEAKDYVTAFMRQSELFHGGRGFDKKNLNAMLVDLYIAGQDTTINTINWGIIYLMSEPEVVRKMQEELDRVIDGDRFILVDDKLNLPYTSAVTNEVQRMANVMPQNLARRTTCDVKINGHLVPRGTTIMPLMSAVLYDERVFPNHLKFDPNRFLDDDGQLKRVDELIPFSCGRRMCPGAEMAKMEIFLILANLYYNYNIGMPTSGEKPSLQKSFGLTTKPMPFTCSVQRRRARF